MKNVTVSLGLSVLLLSACGAPPAPTAPEASPVAGEMGTTSAACEEPVPALSLSDRAVQRRATEAAIWGMSAVNADLMRQEMFAETKGKVNQMLYWSRPADAKNQTLTPNPDAIYFMTFFDMTEVGPIVIEVPPADTGSFAGSIVNIWQVPLEDVGPQGADAGKGGKYLVLPPGYQTKPPAGCVVLQSDTLSGYALLRSNLISHSQADIEKAVSYGKRAKVYPLSQAKTAPPTEFADASGVLFDATIRYDIRFFESLHRIVQTEPWLARDRVMINTLRALGIEKGKPFEPDAQRKALLEAGISEAKAYLAGIYDAGFPEFNPGIHWTMPAPPDAIAAAQNGFSEPNAYPVDSRGTAYTYAFIGIKRLGKAQFYLISIKDKAGQSYDGAQAYRLTVPANAPIEQYWSVTAYDREIHTILNTSRPSQSSQNQELQKNPDGSIELYFGPKPPLGKESNWIPTDPARKFELMFRFYGPTAPLFEKTWKLPDVERVDAH